MQTTWGAANSNQSQQSTTLQVHSPAVQKFIRLIWKDVEQNVTSQSNYQEMVDAIQQEKGNEAKLKLADLKQLIENAFSKAWQKHSDKLKSLKPISPINNSTVKQFKKNVGSLLSKIFIENDILNVLNTCYCISLPDRVSYSFVLAHDIMNKLKNPKQRIVITAFASGLLLQEYLLLSLLHSYGYDNIALNLVDLGYPDPVMLQRLINQTGKAQAQRAIKHYKKEVIRAAGLQAEDKETKQQWIDENKKMFPELAQLMGMGAYDSSYGYQKALDRFKELLPHVKVNVFGNMHEYMQRAQKDRSLKADVITIVDPDLTVFDIAPYPSEANLLGLTYTSIYDTQDPQYKPHIFITLAKNKPVQVYVHTKTYNDAKTATNKDDGDDLSQVFEQDIKDIIKQAEELKANERYTTKFRDWLIKEFGGDYNPEAILEQLEKDKALLNQAQSFDNINAKKIDTILKNLLITNQTLFEIADHPKLNQVAPLYQNYADAPQDVKIAFGLKVIQQMQELAEGMQNFYEMVWYSDPHLAFQELVANTAKDDAIVYLYYQDDPIDMNRPFILERADKANYIKRDVFGPIVGKMLLEAGLGDESNEDDDDFDDDIAYDDNISDDQGDFDDDDDFDDDHIHEVDPNDRYGIVDFKTGKLQMWDNIKGRFSSLDKLRMPK